ncbi:MAG: type VI secretion system ATPase TssH [Candidatus Delongbacteria bacterium]|nr:type VI secretion system ATPase TssH [Candidatus Delongbacteria bacterium]
MKLELKKLIDTLDASMKITLESSAQKCITRSGNEVLIEDFLYVLLEEEKSSFNKLLQHYNIDYQDMKNALTLGIRRATSESPSPVFSPLLILWLEDAFLASKVSFEVDKISETILLFSFFDNASKYFNMHCFQMFNDKNKDEIKILLAGLQENSAKNITSQLNNPHISQSITETELAKYTIDLTKNAQEGKIDPVLCRDIEIKQAIDILLRRRKNNPILVGEAGVGKTAIVEGLALKIINGDVPDYLFGAKILSLDLGALQAGASIKGEFERRLQAIIKEIQSSTEFIILFIDEAHTLIGAGGNEGGSDAANILKPALARGNLRTIAATTWLEYRKYFEKDPALSRRFQKIDVLEPSIEDTITILRGVANKYEEAHGVYIEDQALVASAELSARYITGRQLPDKAIDVLDTACANVKISKTNTPFSLQKINTSKMIVERTIGSLTRDSTFGLGDYAKEVNALTKEQKRLDKELKKLSSNWLKQKEVIKKIDSLKQESHDKSITKERDKLISLQKEGSYIYENVTFNQVAEVISSWTGIPLGSMVKKQTETILSLDAYLQENIIGQNGALSQLSQFLQISVAGLKNENAPAGVFLLVGPSGVGKTETARNIANIMFGGESYLTTINMTEFQEKHTLSRLIGSPPGYVGYGEGGQLTDPVRIKPYSVVLLDEIEKAHPDILNLFYQIFDRGLVNDGEGREIDFKNTIIFMTSNLATDEITNLCIQNPSIEIQEIVACINPILSSYLKPALLGRMNVVPYKNLTENSLEKIVRMRLDAMKKKLLKRSITLEYSQKVLERIVFLSNAIETGARNIDLVINTVVMPQLSKLILDSMVNENVLKKIEIDLDNEHQLSLKTTI